MIGDRRTPHSTNTLSRRRLALEGLEQRIALDSEGVLIGVDPHLTLSFAPDTAAIGDSQSELSATFDAISASAEWQEALLRAFQTWAVHTNADIGVVADGGQSFGAPGASQRDERFGDIRVGATAMSPEVGAVSVPLDNVVAGSWLGDVIFNARFDYQTLDDVLAVALHEAGNVFGLADSNDPASPLFFGSSPVVKQPTATDIANLQALHGVRADDLNENDNGVENGSVNNNDNFANATELRLVSSGESPAGTAPSVVYGDIRDAADVDVFVLDVPSGYTGPLTVQLRTSGVSLLRPSLEVFSGDLQLLDQAASTALEGAILAITIPRVSSGQQFYLRASAAESGVFGVGGYSLVATFDGLNLVGASAIEAVADGSFRRLSQEQLAEFFDGDDFVNDDQGADDEQELAVELETSGGFAEGTRYQVTGSITNASDTDYYRIEPPAVENENFPVLTIAVRSLDAGRLVPAVEVFDADFQVIPTEVLVNGGGQLVVQASGVSSHGDYLVNVRADDPSGLFADGNYEVTAAFGAEAAAPESMAAGVVGGPVGQTVHTLYVGQPQLFHFLLTADEAPAAAPIAVLATVRDDQGAVVVQVAALAGQARSAAAALLDPGTYTAEFQTISLNGSSDLSVAYNLQGLAFSDPFVGDPEDPTGNPFECQDNPGFFCYPFVPDPTPDPFLWDDFIDSLATAPPDLPLPDLVSFLLGDWWTWYWQQAGGNGPPLAQDDNFQAPPSTGASASFALAQSAALVSTSRSVLDNDFDPEGGAFVALPGSMPTNGVIDLRTDGTFDYTPNPGFVGVDQFTYVAYDFSTESQPATVTIGARLPGDYNSDGQVDEVDYAVWRESFGGSNPAADGNGDGVVNAADYTVWRDNFGASIPPPTAAIAVSVVPSAATTAAPDTSPTVSALDAEPPASVTAATVSLSLGSSETDNLFTKNRTSARPLMLEPTSERDATLLLETTQPRLAIGERPKSPQVSSLIRAKESAFESWARDGIGDARERSELRVAWRRLDGLL